eukprot:3203911-Alexandrium_andersonii.AAC.1
MHRRACSTLGFERFASPKEISCNAKFKAGESADRDSREPRAPSLSERIHRGALVGEAFPQTLSAIRVARAPHKVLNAGSPARARDLS